MRLPNAIAVLLAVASGCSMGNLDAALATVDSGSPNSPTAGSTADTGVTTTTNVPVYFTLDGNASVNNEDIEVAQSTVTVEYRNAEGESICTGNAPIVTTTTLLNEDPELDLFGWWELELDVAVCEAFGPSTLGLTLGIGAWDAQLDAAAAAQNLDGAELYAMYVQQSATSPVYVFGAAGTSEQFSGTTPPVDAGPLPDGLYQLQTLYLLTIDPP